MKTGLLFLSLVVCTTRALAATDVRVNFTLNTTEVINRVKQSDNCNDAFLCGLSKGGHMAYAYACERPATLRAACSVDEFMGLASNIPRAPLPIIAFQGTADKNVPYTMQRDSVDAATGVISGTPTATGTTKILLTAGNSAGSTSAGLALTVTLTPPVIPIEAWRSAHFGASVTNPDIAGDTADPDGDDVNNLLEYTNGTDPLAADVLP